MKKSVLKEFRSVAAYPMFAKVPYYVANRYKFEQVMKVLELGIIKHEWVKVRESVKVRVNHARRLRRAYKRGGTVEMNHYIQKVMLKAANNDPILERHNPIPT
jgi:hypothetical protein